ncbi:helix-turn-helix domain-containing protein [Myroides indicus]|uniref:AraC family transcriptional regulator n=1 Tax=Myroides indicus TaxID=1323422 RepID=A0A4R7EYG5_9FLAO|nr:AraC family transcriptional regulator [Myroides indicus]TDS61526.1 AraC family transcriptional regulator [Myroides indicus]
MTIKQLNIQQDYALFAKQSHQTSFHRHYAIELVFCKKGSFDISTETNTYKNLLTALIPSNFPHQFQCVNADCQMLFLDPLSNIGQYITNTYLINSKKEILINQSIEYLFTDTETIVTNLSNDSKNNFEIDFRIENCLSKIQNTPESTNLSIKQLSELSYLSESRLSHLFKEETGISIRQYILWNKIRLAVEKCNKGKSLTTAAHSAGFVDSSHFNKTFFNMFGSSPFFALKS